MKITALLILKTSAAAGDSSSSSSSSSDPVILANASDVSHFGFFQRAAAKEFIIFVGRTVAKRTPPSQRQSVQHEEYKVHSYNRNGLCALAFMDDHYPVRSAFSLLNKVLDEYQKAFGESWRKVHADSTQPWPYLNEALTKFQDPAEADKLLKIQRDLDETKIILGEKRGEKEMGVTKEDVESALTSSLTPSHLQVIDTSGGCGASFEIEIVSEKFEGKRLLERHRMVNAALVEQMKEIHALSIKKALTPSQWKPEPSPSQA